MINNNIGEVMTDGDTIDYLKLKIEAKQKGIGCGTLLTNLKKNSSRGIIAVYGNCQSYVYARLIKATAEIMKSYFLLWFGPVQNIHGEEEHKGFDRELLENIDILIYQEVVGRSWLSQALNTKDIISCLKKEAIAVCIPNIYFDGYFPQHCGNRFDVSYINAKGESRPCFAYGDKNIEMYIRGGHPVKPLQK